MSENTDSADLLKELRVENWSIFTDLAQRGEDELRRILRPHDEAEFHRSLDRNFIVLRRKLDEALGALTLLEIGREIGYYSGEQVEAAQPADLQKLMEGEGSEAFLRYANAYLYFGVRILTSRYFPIQWDCVTPPWERTDDKTNKRFFPLAIPPEPIVQAVSSVATGDLSLWKNEKFTRFLREQRDPRWKVALDFLDDIHEGIDKDDATELSANASTEGKQSQASEAKRLSNVTQCDSGESVQYELWLRGLLPAGHWNQGVSDASTLDQDLARVKARIKAEAQHKRFEEITNGLIAWLDTRVAFYLPFTKGNRRNQSASEAEYESLHPDDTVITNPLAARFALADIYWIARLMRAEVSTNGSVSYARLSWIQLLRFRATLTGRDGLARRLKDHQEIIRSVFDFVCDLVQNAVAVSEQSEQKYFNPSEFPADKDMPGCNKQWRAVFDEELQEIQQQRWRRTYRPPGDPLPEPDILCSHDPNEGWSERLITGREPQNRIGLAFSGGGVRSATFNLGVLQGLQSHDLLRQVDYLSTVSGGGYIGAWLVGNVRRTRHWLGKATCWDESVAHLRSYSSYLAPLTGILSADTWTLAASWIRNTFLIQLSGLTALFALLLAVLSGRMIFLGLADRASRHYSQVGAVVFVMATLVTATLILNFVSNRVETGMNALSASRVRMLAVLPSWIGSFVIAAMLLANAKQDIWAGCPCDGLHNYSSVLAKAWHRMSGIVIADWIAMLLVGWFALKPPLPNGYVKAEATAAREADAAAKAYDSESNTEAGTGRFSSRARWAWLQFRQMVIGSHPIWRRLWRSLWIGTLCVVVLYLALCAVLYLYLAWPDMLHLVWKTNEARFDSYAFVFGPALVLIAFTLSVVLFIGLTGRRSNEAQREWWTRYGAWLTIYATVGLALSSAAVLGPALVERVMQSAGHASLKWGTIASWIGTVIGGLFAGNSSKTAGDGSAGKKVGLEILAKIGGLLFVVGFVVGAALVLYFFLLNFATNDLAGTDYWETLNDFDDLRFYGVFIVIILLGLLFSYFFEINIFGLSQFYRNRLVRCFLGATRWAPGVRKPHPFTKFDFKDDMPLSDLKKDFRGPFPIFNCTLNLAGSADLAVRTRHSASFSLTPLRCGSDRPKVGYAPTGNSNPHSRRPGFAGGVKLGQAIAISGAAVSPNMGYNTSPLVALLLTMFNVRLGWWFPNPGKHAWGASGLRFSLYYLTKELLGIAGENRQFLNVTDGGHFENLGVYELIRRRCKVIIACDAECDEVLQFGALGNLVRICATDFGAVIDIEVKSIREQKDDHSLAHCTVGKIKYSNGSIGYLIYLKASVTGDEDIGIAQYRSSHPSFPHETTANQFFTEDQFESYRKLGLHIVHHALRGSQPGDDPLSVAEKLADVTAPTGVASEAFLKHTNALQHKWEEFRKAEDLYAFVEELMSPRPPQQGTSILSPDELCMALELVQLMEDVYMDLRLDDFWEHPDNRGWAIMFMRWARSPRFQAAWAQTRRTFGIRFEYFCEARLGLTRDIPIVRV